MRFPFKILISVKFASNKARSAAAAIALATSLVAGFSAMEWTESLPGSHPHAASQSHEFKQAKEILAHAQPILDESERLFREQVKISERLRSDEFRLPSGKSMGAIEAKLSAKTKLEDEIASKDAAIFALEAPLKRARHEWESYSNQVAQAVLQADLIAALWAAALAAGLALGAAGVALRGGKGRIWLAQGLGGAAGGIFLFDAAPKAALALLREPMWIQNLYKGNAVVGQLRWSMVPLLEIMELGAYGAGIAIATKGAMRLKRIGLGNPDDTYAKAVTEMAVGACLLAIPTFLTTGVDTVWGGSTSTIAPV